MPSSDVITRKPGSDFYWLIVQTFAKLCIIMRNFSVIFGGAHASSKFGQPLKRKYPMSSKL